MKYFSTDRLYSNWVYGGFLASFLVIGLTPLICSGWSAAMVLVFLQLPVYMLHQYEEHDADRFREFVNDLLGGGRELLSPKAVFVINIFGVWGVDLASILLARYVNIGFGLVAVYLTLLNAVAHIGQGVALKRYNPGLVTAVVLFLPIGGMAAWVVSREVVMGYQVLGMASAILIHVLIVAHVVRQKARLALQK